MDYDWDALPNELKRRANEVYEATGIDLSLLHQYKRKGPHRSATPVWEGFQGVMLSRRSLWSPLRRLRLP